MKNALHLKAVLLVITLMGTQWSFAQTPFTCGTDAMHKKLVEEHPEVLQWEAKMDSITKAYAVNHPNGSQRSGPYVIPIVFHIIHRGGTENISDAQVQDEVRILNEDYNKLNADRSDVIPDFQPIIADLGITFRLATIDPHGNPTNGIDHIYSSQTWQGGEFAKLDPWPRDKYLNVWVVSKMEMGVAGYAFLPPSVAIQGEIPGHDGVIILSDYIGAIGTSTYFTGRALTHEIGHYLNLEHPWGGSNSPGVACGDDGVDDTPITKGWLSCPSPDGSRICDATIRENYQNYMDYSYCSRMFTAHQKDRMLAALTSTVADRATLWSTDNLIATGTETLVAPVSAPTADFSANKQFVCVGDKVTFTDNSFNGTVDTRYWSFPNGDIDNSTAAKPIVAFQTSGWQTITLTVSNAHGSSTKTDAHVFVGDPNNQFGTPYFNGFEDEGEFSTFWAPFNYDRDLPHFQFTSIASHTGNSSILLDNYLSRADHNVDELITPAFDCSALDANTAKLSFFYSYGSWNQHFNGDLADSMAVYAQKACAGNWVKIYSDGSNSLVNAGYQTGYFIPGKDWAFWKKLNITIPVSFRAEKVRFKIQIWGAHDSNNFYMDDLSVGVTTTGIEDGVIKDLAVMPNPFNSNVQIQNLGDGKYDLSVIDITGREVLKANGLTPEQGNINLDMSAISVSGVYFVKLTDGKSFGTLKLIKQ